VHGEIAAWPHKPWRIESKIVFLLLLLLVMLDSPEKSYAIQMINPIFAFTIFAA